MSDVTQILNRIEQPQEHPVTVAPRRQGLLIGDLLLVRRARSVMENPPR